MKQLLLLKLLGINLAAFALPTNFSVRSQEGEVIGANILVKKIYAKKNPTTAISCKNIRNSRLDVCQLGTLTDIDGNAQLELDRFPEFNKFIIEISFIGMHSKTLVVDKSKKQRTYKAFLYNDPYMFKKLKRQTALEKQREKEILAMLNGKPYPKHVKIYNALMNEVKRVGGEENFINKIDNEEQYAKKITKKYTSILDFMIRKFYPILVD
jgi:hypothetical protein